MSRLRGGSANDHGQGGSAAARDEKQSCFPLSQSKNRALRCDLAASQLAEIKMLASVNESLRAELARQAVNLQKLWGRR